MNCVYYELCVVWCVVLCGGARVLLWVWHYLNVPPSFPSGESPTEYPDTGIKAEQVLHQGEAIIVPPLCR